jgi:hypothetical protein
MLGPHAAPCAARCGASCQAEAGVLQPNVVLRIVASSQTDVSMASKAPNVGGTRCELFHQSNQWAAHQPARAAAAPRGRPAPRPSAGPPACRRPAARTAPRAASAPPAPPSATAPAQLAGLAGHTTQRIWPSGSAVCPSWLDILCCIDGRNSRNWPTTCSTFVVHAGLLSSRCPRQNSMWMGNARSRVVRHHEPMHCAGSMLHVVSLPGGR